MKPLFLNRFNAHIVVFLGILLLSSVEAASVDVQQHLKQIQAYCAVMDFTSACEEAESALSAYFYEEALHAAYIKALSHSGNEKAVWNAWNDYQNTFPDKAKDNYELYEAMAWGAIYHGTESPLPMIRLYALLGAFFLKMPKVFRF